MATLKMLVLVLVLLVRASRATTTPSPSPDPELKWNCPEVSVQANASVQQIIGEWFVLELEGSPQVNPRDACSVLSFNGSRDEGNNSFSVVLSIRIPPNDHGFRHDAYYHRDKPQDLVLGNQSIVWRLHSLSDDGQVLVLVACNVRKPDAVYRMTLGASANVNPPSRAANSSSSGSVVRRDDNYCKVLKWNCQEVSVQANASVQQIIGEWFVLELEGSPQATLKDACSTMSFTGPHELGNNIFSVVFTINIPPYNHRSSYEVYYHRDKPQELVPRNPTGYLRLHSLSADGQLLVLVMCNVRKPDAVYRVTLGASVNVNPPSRAANSRSSVVRRDNNLCKELAEESDTMQSSN